MASGVIEQEAEPCGREAGPEGQRFVLDGVSWKEYELILKAIGERRVFVTFDRGDLEIMSPSIPHSRDASMLDRIIEALAVEWEMPFYNLDMVTVKKSRAKRGLEPDKAFFFQSTSRVKAIFTKKKKYDFAVDPPPDLGVEVDVFSSSVGRLPVY